MGLERDWWAVLKGSSTEPWGAVGALVENSLDSFTQSISVQVRQGDGGHLVITVRDWGEGMGYSQLTDALLTFPGTTRGDDLLSLGGSGTGFAACFRDNPELIEVESSYRGLHTLTAMEAGGEYTIFRVPGAFDGTRVTLHTRKSGELDQVVPQLRRYLSTRFAHATTPIELNGEVLSRPFTLTEAFPDVRFEILLQDGEERIVLGYSATRRGTGRIFSHGKWIMDVHSPVPWVSFMVDTPFARGQEGRGYPTMERTVDALVAKVAGEHTRSLQEALFTYLEGLAERVDMGGEVHRLLWLVPRALEAPLYEKMATRRVLPSPLQGSCSIAEMTSRDICYLTRELALAGVLMGRGEVVLDAEVVDRGVLQALLAKTGCAGEVTFVDPADHFILYELVNHASDSLERRLMQGLKAILAALTQRPAEAPIHAMAPLSGGSALDPWYEAEGDPLIRKGSPLTITARGTPLLINFAHPLMAAVLRIADCSAASGLIFMAWALMLQAGLRVDPDRLVPLAARLTGGARP